MAKPTSEATEKKGLLLDQEIKDVLHQIKSIDGRIKSLNNKRIIHMEKYEKLNEAKLMYESEASASEQNWESGKWFSLLI